MNAGLQVEDLGLPVAAQRWTAAATTFSRWRAGDARALDDLVRLLTPVLWHVVRASGLSVSRAEDVLQSTWLLLVRNADGVHDPQAVGGWLLTTARREATRVARAEARVRPVDDEFLTAAVPIQRSAEHEVLDHDRDEHLWQAVQQLPERCQRLLRVIAFADRPDYDTLAHDLNMPKGSIGPTRGRCLARLRQLLGGTAADRST